MNKASTCPDWSALVLRRDEDPDFDQSAEWQEALTHLDADCSCREQALSADPTLLFRRLIAPTPARDEVEDMRRAVRTLRRTSRTAQDPRPRRAANAWRITAVAAALTLFFGGLNWNSDRSDSESAPVQFAATTPVVEQIAEPASAPAVESMPLVEDVDPNLGELIQLMDEEISIVLVVSPSDDDSAAELNV